MSSSENQVGSGSKWPIIDALPSHEPTEADFVPRLRALAQSLLQRSQDTSNPQAARFASSLLNGSPDSFIVGIEAEMRKEWAFRKLHAEGRISDEAMQKLDEAEEMAIAYQSAHFDGELPPNGKGQMFRGEIIPAYLFFQDADLVKRAIELIIVHGERAAAPPLKDQINSIQTAEERRQLGMELGMMIERMVTSRENEGDNENNEEDDESEEEEREREDSLESVFRRQRNQKHNVHDGLQLARDLYYDNKTFAAVEAFFTTDFPENN